VTIGIRESIDRLNIQFCAGKKEHEVNNNSVYISRDKNEKLLNVKKVDKPNTLKLSFYLLVSLFFPCFFTDNGLRKKITEKQISISFFS
jgi:hypothetical protein